MRNLILLFLRYGGFIVFLLFEALCMFLVIRYNRTQREVYVNSANIVTATLYEQMDNMTKFWSLSSTADSLARENARLHSLIKNMNQVAITPLVAEDDTTYIEPPDTIETIEQYQYIPAKVVNNSTNRNNNTLTLNKGSKHNIQIRKGVASDKGIVGITRFVSEHYTTVMSILNRQVRVSTAIKRNNYIGSLAWRGNDPTRMKLEDVPNHADIQVGDTVITSGFTPAFPRGIMVGKIDTFWVSSGNGFYDIEVKLSNDLNNIQYVYVIENKLANEQEQVEKEVGDEQ